MSATVVPLEMAQCDLSPQELSLAGFREVFREVRGAYQFKTKGSL